MPNVNANNAEQRQRQHNLHVQCSHLPFKKPPLCTPLPPFSLLLLLLLCSPFFSKASTTRVILPCYSLQLNVLLSPSVEEFEEQLLQTLNKDRIHKASQPSPTVDHTLVSKSLLLMNTVAMQNVNWYRSDRVLKCDVIILQTFPFDL